MTRRPTRLNRFLRCESLEPRCMLAGDVTARVTSAGHLIITGDAQSNAIQVEAGLLPGQYTITGLNDDQSQPTTVNHAGSVTVSGVTGDIRIQLNDGKDQLFIAQNAPLSVAGDLRIGTDLGDDNVQIGNVTVGANVVIQLGDGADNLLWNASTVVGNVTINGGAPGTQEIVPGGFLGEGIAVTDVGIGGSLDIRTGTGYDFVTVSFGNVHTPSSVGGDITVNTGAGGDSFYITGSVVDGHADGNFTTAGNLTVSLGEGQDTFQASYTNVAGNVEIHGGDGDDSIDIGTESTVHGTTYVTGNAGADSVTFDNTAVLIGDLNVVSAGDGDVIILSQSSFGNVTITTGAGDDFVFVQQCHFTGNVTFNLGAGNDTFISDDSVYDHVVSILMGAGDDETDLSNNTFLGPTTIDGGKGADHLDDQGGNVFGDTSTVTHYES